MALNLWLAEPRFFTYLEKEFSIFLEHLDNPVSGQFDLPQAIFNSSLDFDIPIKVKQIDSGWMGLTHHEDQYSIKEKLSILHQEKVYPTPLWK